METSLVVQWLTLDAFTAGAPDSIPGWGSKILQHVPHGQKKKTLALSQWSKPLDDLYPSSLLWMPLAL